MQLENRRADDFLLVLYTPARMFFNCTGIPGLGQDCMRIVDCNGIGVIVLCVCRCGCVLDCPDWSGASNFIVGRAEFGFRVEVKVVADLSRSWFYIPSWSPVLVLYAPARMFFNCGMIL